MTTHALVLRIPVEAGANLALLSDAMGEFARDLESIEPAENVGLVPDFDDPGRYAWSIVAEAYPGIGE